MMVKLIDLPNGIPRLDQLENFNDMQKRQAVQNLTNSSHEKVSAKADNPFMKFHVLNLNWQLLS